MEINKSLLKKGTVFKVLSPLDIIFCPRGLYEITSVRRGQVYFKVFKSNTHLRYTLPVSYVIENYFRFKIDENNFIIQEDK